MLGGGAAPTYSRTVDDAVESFCRHFSVSVIKIISQQQHRPLTSPCSENGGSALHDAVLINHEFVDNVYRFLSMTRFSLLDGSEMRSQIVRREIAAFRGSIVGKCSKWEPLIAMVGLSAAKSIRRGLGVDDGGDGADRGRTTMIPPSFIETRRVEHCPQAIRLAISIVSGAMQRGAKALPACCSFERLCLFMQQEDAGGVPCTEPAWVMLERFLLRGLHTSESGTASSEWSRIAARLAAQVFGSFLRDSMVAGALPAPCTEDFCHWRQDTWDALVTIIGRVGVATPHGEVLPGVVVPFNVTRDIAWVRRRPSADSAAQSTICLSDNFELHVVVLLRDLVLASEAESHSCLVALTRILLQSAPLNVGLLKQQSLCGIVLVEEDLDTITRQHMTGWGASLQYGGHTALDMMLDEGPLADTMLNLCVLTSVGKAAMFRLATTLQTLPGCDWREASVAACAPQGDRKWELALRSGESNGEDAGAYVASRKQVVRSQWLAALSLHNPIADNESSPPHIGVLICGPTPPTVSALESLLWMHLSVLRCAWASASGGGLVPGHGLPLAVCSVAAARASIDAMGMLGHGEEEEEDVKECLRWCLPVAAKAISQSIDTYLTLILCHSFGLSTEAAMERVAAISAQLHTACEAGETSAVHHGGDKITTASDLYCHCVEHPPLYFAADHQTTPTLDTPTTVRQDMGLARALPTVALADIFEWHSLREVGLAIASACRIASTLASVGVVTPGACH